MERETMLTLICLGFFAMIVLSIYFKMKFRTEMPISTIDESLDSKRKWDWQKPGIVVVGIGVGILISGLMSEYDCYDNYAINVGIIAVCAGISMIVANALDKDNSSEA